MFFPCQCYYPLFLDMGKAEEVVILIELLQCEKMDLHPTMTWTI